MSGKDTILSMICFIALIAVAMFYTVAVGVAGWCADPTPEENATRIFSQLQFPWRLPVSHAMLLVHGEIQPIFTGRATQWFELSVPAQDVPGIERVLGRSLRSVSKLPATESHAPDWWHPETLADAQIYSTDGLRTGRFYVTSCATGTIYYYRQGH
jgi:hypothetical protein